MRIKFPPDDVFSQKDYICFDFVPRHHNIIRFRKGMAMIKDSFHTVCSWVRFPNRQQWKYDLLLGKCAALAYGFSRNHRSRVIVYVF